MSAHDDANPREIAHLLRARCIGQHSTDAGGLYPVGDVPGGEQWGSGDRHGPQASEAEHRDPPLGHARKHDEDAIPAADALAGDVGLPRRPGQDLPVHPQDAHG